MAHRFSPVLIAFAMSIALPLRASGQRESSSIPIDLARALVHPPIFIFEGDPKFSVGTLPTGWPAELAPPAHARVVGGLSSVWQQSTVLAYHAPSAEALASTQVMLDRAGYKRPPREVTGGFQDAATPAAYLCKGTIQATVFPAPSKPPESLVQVSLRGGRPGAATACTNSVPRTHQWSADLTIPALISPEGVQVYGSGSGGGSDQVESTARASSTLSPSVLLALYAKQLEAAGWRLGAPLANESAGLQSIIEAKDRNGASWYGALTVAAGATRRDLVLRMVRMKE